MSSHPTEAITIAHGESARPRQDRVMMMVGGWMQTPFSLWK